MNRLKTLALLVPAPSAAWRAIKGSAAWTPATKAERRNGKNMGLTRHRWSEYKKTKERLGQSEPLTAIQCVRRATAFDSERVSSQGQPHRSDARCSTRQWSSRADVRCSLGKVCTLLEYHRQLGNRTATENNDTQQPSQTRELPEGCPSRKLLSS